LQNFVFMRKFLSAANENFHGIMNEAAVRIVRSASWNSPSSVKSLNSLSSLSVFLDDVLHEQQLILKWRRLRRVDAGFASSTQPREDRSPRDRRPPCRSFPGGGAPWRGILSLAASHSLIAEQFAPGRNRPSCRF
jgi:hypothetical protein